MEHKWFLLTTICVMVDKNPSPLLTKVFLGRMIFNRRAEQWYHYNRGFTVGNVVLFIFL